MPSGVGDGSGDSSFGDSSSAAAHSAGLLPDAVLQLLLVSLPFFRIVEGTGFVGGEVGVVDS